VITDGEPTAHLDRDGEWWFSWPPGPETIALTLAEVDKMTRRGVPLSFFRLGDDPRLAQFLTTSRAATAAGSSRPRATGSATTSSATTSGAARADAAPPEP
jgi:uncharacterized protein with von Willebrand factor type A (vWA) domain